MALDLSKCEPGTLYQDARGNLYRVLGYCMEPTVSMVRLEDQARLSGGRTGLMWDGFKPVKIVEDAGEAE